jgi:Asp-tRNA(Asn)/Glu-tRNA(Gln) amidotransferase C subunit
MRKQIGSSCCFLQIQSYQRVLADRFFGGWEQFIEFSRFLKLGKSYREIASQTTDYHQLFKSLLPTPGTEKFEPVIEALSSLESSRDQIEGLVEKLEYIKELTELLDNIKYNKKMVHTVECLALNCSKEEVSNSIELKKREKNKISKKIATIIEMIKDNQEARDKCELLKDDYKQKDNSGLVRQEQDLKKDVIKYSNNLKTLNKLI